MNNKKQKNTKQAKVMDTCRVVEMDKRRDVVLINSDIDKKTEDEIRDLRNEVSFEKKQLYQMYYAKNTPVMQIKHRKFSDLVKKFFETLKEENGTKMIGGKRTI
jgi:hypothetical protein